eukprot:1184652-Prorocentrum_minimum.AAC.2
MPQRSYFGVWWTGELLRSRSPLRLYRYVRASQGAWQLCELSFPARKRFSKRGVRSRVALRFHRLLHNGRDPARAHQPVKIQAPSAK